MLKAEETDQMIPLVITTPQCEGHILCIVLWEHGGHASRRSIALAPFPFEESAIFYCPSQWLRQLCDAAGRCIRAHMLHF